MRNGRLRMGALLTALVLPLGGCLEIAGSKMNREASVAQDSGCPRGAQSAGETVNYGCPRAAQ